MYLCRRIVHTEQSMESAAICFLRLPSMDFWFVIVPQQDSVHILEYEIDADPRAPVVSSLLLHALDRENHWKSATCRSNQPKVIPLPSPRKYFVLVVTFRVVLWPSYVTLKRLTLRGCSQFSSETAQRDNTSYSSGVVIG